jgi:Alginate export
MLCAASSQAASACPSEPRYSLVRYDDDFSYLRDPACHNDYWDSLKYIPYDAQGHWYLSFGGEIRERYERFYNPAWGQQPQSPGGYLLQRYLFFADIHLGSHVRAFAELMSDWETFRVGGPRPQIDEDQLDFSQFFVDLMLQPFGLNDTLTLRVGRQWLVYGSQRLISDRYGPNVPLPFDGVRAILNAEPWRVDSFVVKPVETNLGVFDDKTRLQTTFWGLYAVRPLSFITGGNVDLYYLGIHNKLATYADETGTETRHTLGTRLWGARGPWDSNSEFVGQTGVFHDGYILAWSAATDTGYTLEEVPHRPRIGLRAGVASGDHDKHGPNLQTFNPLFPTGFYFSQAILNGPLNVISIQPNLTLSLTDTITINTIWSWFWRQSTNDGVYGLSGMLVRPVGTTSDTYVGDQAQLTFDWQLDKHTHFQVNYLHFFVGGYLEDTKPTGKDVDFVTTSIQYLF